LTKNSNLNNKISVIIPTYNEKENLKQLIGKILKVLPGVKIVIVDDSPNNETLNSVSSFIKNKKAYAISRKFKNGRGSAVLEGLKYAHNKFKSNYYIEMDADLSHNADELPLVLKECGIDKVVVASRYIKGSKIVNWPLERRLASKLSNLLVKFILDIPLNDNTNGFRAYPRNAVQKVLKKKFISNGHIVLSEMAYMLKKNYTFSEVPSIFYNRRKGRSSANIREFLRAFRDLIRIRLAH
jgi:dolichol-phosphate mannosyltransferase